MAAANHTRISRVFKYAQVSLDQNDPILSHKTNQKKMLRVGLVMSVGLPLSIIHCSNTYRTKQKSAVQ